MEHLDRQTSSNVRADVIAQLSALDDDLVEVIVRGDIRLVRSSWFLQQPEDFRMPRRQTLESDPDALLTPEDACELIRRGDRSVGVLSHGWLCPGDPDPEGARAAVLRNALQLHPRIEAFFFE